MTIIEVNLAGFQFTRCVPDAAGPEGRHAWHITRAYHLRRLHAGRRRAPRLRVA